METDHGPVETPIFMPVGTAAAMKGIFHRDLRDDARARIIRFLTFKQDKYAVEYSEKRRAKLSNKTQEE